MVMSSSTDFSQNDAQMKGFDDCANQRNLTDKGRDEARAVGAGLGQRRLRQHAHAPGIESLGADRFLDLGPVPDPHPGLGLGPVGCPRLGSRRHRQPGLHLGLRLPRYLADRRQARRPDLR